MYAASSNSTQPSLNFHENSRKFHPTCGSSAPTVTFLSGATWQGRMARTPQRTLNQDLIVTSGDAITGDDATGGAGGDLVLEGGDAASGSNADAGDVLVRPGLPDGTGVRGVVNITNNGGADTVPVLQLTSQGANGEDIRLLVGTQDPSSTVSANPGDVYIRHSGSSSTVKVNTGAADGNTTWTDLAGGGSSVSAGLPGGIYQNLVFYVDPSDRNSYPSTGTSVTDIMGNGTSGTLASATFVNGNFQFNGTSGSLTFTKGAALDNIFSGGGTVVVFYKPNSDGEASDARIVDTTDGSDEGWYFATTGDTTGRQNFRFQRNFSGSTGGTWNTAAVVDPISGSTVLPIILGPWTCVAVVYDDASTANDPTFYVNGRTTTVTEATAPVGTAVSDAGNGLIFANRTADDRTFDGDIGPILMFDRSLTANEIRVVFNNFGRRMGLGQVGVNNSTGSAQSAYIIGGESTGTTDQNAGDVLVQGGSQDGTTGGGRAGDVVIRGGVLTGTHNAAGRPGNIIIASGAQTSSGGSISTVQIYAGDCTTNGSIGQDDSVLIHGMDVTGTSTSSPGGVTIRGGNAPDAGNDSGGNVVIQGGLGDVSAGGDVFIRSGGQVAPNTLGATGSITISTDRNGTGGTGTDTGSITITTTGTGATADTSGNITISTGNVAATTGNNPGDITITGGNQGTAGQAAVTAGSINVTGGSNAGGNTAHGGSITLTGGNQTNTGSITGTGGDITLLGGSTASTSASSRGGNLSFTAGSGVGTGSVGGSVAITAGNATGTAAAGSVTLTGGTPSTGTPGGVALRTSANTAAVSVRTQSTFTGTSIEHFTHGFQATLAPSGTNDLTLGSLTVNGRNLKLDVYVTGVNNASVSSMLARYVVQTWYRDSTGTVSGLGTHVSSSQNSGTGAGTFAADILFVILASGSNIVLRTQNSSGANTYTGNFAVWWTRQEGGFAS